MHDDNPGTDLHIAVCMCYVVCVFSDFEGADPEIDLCMCLDTAAAHEFVLYFNVDPHIAVCMCLAVYTRQGAVPLSPVIKNDRCRSTRC